MLKRSQIACVTALWCAPLAPVLSQSWVTNVPARWVGASIEGYDRLLQLTGVMPLSSLMLRPTDYARNYVPPDSAPWRAPWRARYGAIGLANTKAWSAEVIDPQVQSTYNSAVPYGMNDGAMWGGRGVSGIVTLGARVRRGPVTVQMAPQFTWSKNNAFPVAQPIFGPPNVSPYANRWLSRGIDLPQRFGEHASARGDAGQSSVTISAHGVKLGASNESMWWGPGIDNALLMTNNAPGFLHTVLGTSRPVNVGIGKLELLHTIGWLKQSNYWRIAADTFATNRWLNSFAFVFEPRGAEGMYFGASRTFYAYERYNPITLREIASTLIQSLEKEPLAAASDSGRDDVRDQMFSLWFRWVFPQAGFETYGELGRNDHPWDRRDLVLEPDHSRAYVLGAQKVFKLDNGLLAMKGEATGLGQTRTMLYRATPVWYVHRFVRQGYTNRGQVVGAGIGPGGDQQSFAVDWLRAFGSVGLTVQRQQVASDGLYKAYNTRDGGFQVLHDVFLGAGPRLRARVGGMDVSLLYLQQHEYNRANIQRNDFDNAHLDLRVNYAPGASRSQSGSS